MITNPTIFKILKGGWHRHVHRHAHLKIFDAKFGRYNTTRSKFCPGMTAITPLGPKIDTRNDRYNTNRPKIRQKARNDRGMTYNTTLLN